MTLLPEQSPVLLPVSEDDFDTLAELRIRAMRDSLTRLGRFDPERARARLRQTFAPAHTRHIVLDGQRIGFVALLPAGDHLQLDHLYLDPAFQGRGIGAWVMRQVLAEADAASLPIRLGALRGSDANRFYRRLGFVQVDEAEWDLYYERTVPAGLP